MKNIALLFFAFSLNALTIGDNTAVPDLYIHANLSPKSQTLTIHLLRKLYFDLKGIDFLNSTINKSVHFSTPVSKDKLGEDSDLAKTLLLLGKYTDNFKTLDDIFKYPQDFIEILRARRNPQMDLLVEQVVLKVPKIENKETFYKDPALAARYLTFALSPDIMRPLLFDLLGSLLGHDLEKSRLEVNLSGFKYSVKDLNIDIKSSNNSDDGSIDTNVKLALNNVRVSVPLLKTHLSSTKYYNVYLIDNNLKSSKTIQENESIIINLSTGDLIYKMPDQDINVGQINKNQGAIDGLLFDQNVLDKKIESQFHFNFDNPKAMLGNINDFYIELPQNKLWYKDTNGWNPLEVFVSQDFFKIIKKNFELTQNDLLEYINLFIYNPSVSIAFDNFFELNLKLNFKLDKNKNVLKISLLKSSFDFLKNLTVEELEKIIQLTFVDEAGVVKSPVVTGFLGLQVAGIGIPFRPTNILNMLQKDKEYVTMLVYKPIIEKIRDLPGLLFKENFGVWDVESNKKFTLKIPSIINESLSANIAVKSINIAKDDSFQIYADTDFLMEGVADKNIESQNQSWGDFLKSVEDIKDRHIHNQGDVFFSFDSSALAKLVNTAIESKSVTDKLPPVFKIGPKGIVPLFDNKVDGRYVVDFMFYPKRKKAFEFFLRAKYLRFPVIITPQIDFVSIDGQPHLTLALKNIEFAPTDFDYKRYGLENNLDKIQFSKLMKNAVSVIEDEIKYFYELEEVDRRGFWQKILGKVFAKLIKKNIDSNSLPVLPLPFLKNLEMLDFDLYSDGYGRINLLIKINADNKKLRESLSKPL
jgi:hypothetical protein